MCFRYHGQGRQFPGPDDELLVLGEALHLHDGGVVEGARGAHSPVRAPVEVDVSSPLQQPAE